MQPITLDYGYVTIHIDNTQFLNVLRDGETEREYGVIEYRIDSGIGKGDVCGYARRIGDDGFGQSCWQIIAYDDLNTFKHKRICANNISIVHHYMMAVAYEYVAGLI